MKGLRVLLSRPDLAVVAILVCAITVMIMPLPTWLVDLFLALNISASVLLVMVAFYLRSSVQFTTLPAVILLATLVRLSLSIAVTRLVLTQGYAGEIIQAFGRFVVGGDVLIGMVIFLIITVVQFIVIAKGSERVAEVAARFMLDAMPGKQLAIDADVRNGQLSQDDARSRRSELERESHLYGAMDGAMKFVKGDAIAGIVIIVVNLLGGLAIGMLQRGMSFSDAAHTYSILTIGDGLVAQIPALLIAVTAGTVVTRIAGTDSDNLGTEIIAQIVRDERAIILGGVVSLLLALVPGFPTVIFLAIGASLISVAVFRKRAVKRAAEASTEAAVVAAPPPAPSRLSLHLGTGLIALVDQDRLDRRLAQAVLELGGRIGIGFPTLGTRTDPLIEANNFRLDLDGVPLSFGSLPTGRLMLTDDRDHARLADIDVETCDPASGVPGRGWIDVGARDQLEAFGIGFAEMDAVLVMAIEAILAEHADSFMGIQEAKQILAQHEAQWGDLVRESQRILPLQKMADLFRRLLADGLSLTPMRAILETVVDSAGAGEDPATFAEDIRAGMRRQICYSHADQLRVIAAYMIDPDAEAAMRGGLRQSPHGPHLVLPGTTTAALVERIRSEFSVSRGPAPVLLTSQELRRHLRASLKNVGLSVPVLAFNDILPNFTVQPLGTIKVPQETGGMRAHAPVVPMNVAIANDHDAPVMA